MTEREIHLWAWNNLVELGRSTGIVYEDSGRGGDGPPARRLAGLAMRRVFGLIELLQRYPLDDLTPEALLALFHAAIPRESCPSAVIHAAKAMRRCLDVDIIDRLGDQRIYIKVPH